MAHITHHSKFWAGCLLLIMGSYLMVQGMHTLGGHAPHAEGSVCDLKKDGASPHLHNGHVKFDDCQICKFCLSAVILPDIPEVLPPLGAFADETQAICTPACVKTACDTTTLRGPPVL